ncbi:MAG: peptidoglycan editing factor PgeF [Simkaniaceae bacterium]|nr:peptidoglycan editing factor PgeF [Simkaniaceae bacterium]MCF7852408.1 peptidoglycan editing factor PgeF [Simkaniaceae bacterium]
MIIEQKKDLRIGQFEKLLAFPEVEHGVVLRSLPEDSSFDASIHCGIEKGMARLKENFSLNQIVIGKQVHSAHVSLVQKSLNSLTTIDHCDGLITVHKGVALMVFHADCQAALFYDPITQVIANVHCGWRGQVKNIYKITVEKLKISCGVDPKNLIVCLSPSLGPDHAQFIHYRQEFPQSFWKFQEKDCYFNLWEIAKWQLMNEGILESNIESAQACTHCDSKHYYSYRRDQTTKRHASWLLLKN